MATPPPFSTLGLVPRHPAILLAAIIYSRERCIPQYDISPLTAASIVRDFRRIGLKDKRPDPTKDPVGYAVELCNYLKTTLMYKMDDGSGCVTLKNNSPLAKTSVDRELDGNWLETIIREIRPVFSEDAARLEQLLPPPSPPPRYISVAEAISLEKPIVTRYWENRRRQMDHKRALAAARVVDVNRNTDARRYSVISTESETATATCRNKYTLQPRVGGNHKVGNNSNIGPVDDDDHLGLTRKRNATTAFEENTDNTIKKKRTRRDPTTLPSDLIQQASSSADTAHSSDDDSLEPETELEPETGLEADHLSALDEKYLFVPDFLLFGTKKGTFQTLDFTQRFDACCKAAQKAIEWAYSMHPSETAKFGKILLRFHRVRKIRYIKDWHPKTYSNVYRSIRLGDTSLGVTEDAKGRWIKTLQTMADGTATLPSERLNRFKAELFKTADESRATDIDIYKHMEPIANFSLPEVCVALRSMSAQNEGLWYNEQNGNVMYL